MDDEVFNGLLEAAKEALAHCKGAKLDLRTTELPVPSHVRWGLDPLE